MVCGGCDFDDIFAYTTDRRVRVRHKWVGGLYYLTMICILAYTIVYQVVFLRGYLVLQPIVGTVRSTVAPAKSANEPPITSLSYCQQHGQQLSGVQLPCASFEPLVDSLKTPDIGILVGTRLSSSLQTKNWRCVGNSYGCTMWLDSPAPRDDAYIGNIENATIYIQHAVASGAADPSPTPDNHLIDTFAAPANRTVKLVGPGTPEEITLDVEKVDGGDILTLGRLTEAAGIHLDDETRTTSSHAPFAGNTTTSRYSGTTLRVVIEYEVDGYIYRVDNADTQSKRESIRWSNDTHRMVDDIHGIQLIFTQTSAVYKFDVRTLLLTLVSGFALLSSAKIVADYYVLYFSPDREKYKLFVQKMTPDFSPDNADEERVLVEILARKRKKRNQLLGLKDEGGAAQAARSSTINGSMNAPLVVNQQ